MSEDGQSQKKHSVKKGNNEDDTPMEHEGDTDNENIAKDKMEGNKRSSPRRKYLKEQGSGVLEKIDKKGKNKGDDDSSEEAEAGDEVKSKPSKSEDEEYVPEPPAKRRRLVRSIQENVSSEENSQGKKSKPVKGKKGKKRAAKRITPKKSKASKKKAKAEEDEAEYEVEKIVKVKILKNGKKEFLIHWKGFSSEHDTWEPEANLTCKELVNQYFEEHKEEEIEAPDEEEKKNKKGKSKRHGSSRPSRPTKSDSAAGDAEGSAKGNAKKGKGNLKKSRGKGKKRQTRARNTGAKSGRDGAAVTDSEVNSGEKTKKTEKDEGENTSQNTGDSSRAKEKAKHAGTTKSEGKKEYEVEKIVDVRQRKEERQFLIKWRGYSSKFNSWESENDMNCNEKIEKFLRTMEQSFTERELRVVRKKTNRFVADNRGRGRKLSVRLGKMPRKSYSEID